MINQLIAWPHLENWQHFSLLNATVRETILDLSMLKIEHRPYDKFISPLR